MSKETIQTIQIGKVEVPLNGKPFMICVDTFDGTDWFGGYYDNNEEAIKAAEKRGEKFLMVHAYDKDGKHIGEGGEL